MSRKADAGKMAFLKLESLSRKLAFLVILAALPALAILLYSGLEHRKRSIESAESKVLQLTHSIAQAQQEITNSTRQVLSTLSLLPALQALDANKCNRIFKAILQKNPGYHNVSLTDINGDIVASGRAFGKINLADRKHIREALGKKSFAAGEYIVSRIGSTVPSFAFSYPVVDQEEVLKGVLSIVIKLDNFALFHDALNLPERSFISLTDYRGIRLFYHPVRKDTNPVGRPIKRESWDTARNAKEPGIFVSTGSDGLKRILAFEQIRLSPGDAPYLYVWAGIPEAHILGPVKTAMIRNLLLMLAVMFVSLLIAWLIGRKTEALIESLEKASNEINTLRGILPICSFCKKIRNDEGAYEQLEGYLHKRSDVDFSHTICPECLREHYPDFKGN